MNSTRITRRHLLATSALSVASAASPLPVRAQTWPARPVKIVVPSPAGGSADMMARTMGRALQHQLAQSFVIENRPGAGLRIGADFVAKSPPDGHTLLLAAVHLCIAQAVYRKRAYELERDLAPISIIAVMPNVLVVPASLPARNLREFIALAQTQPGRLAYGSTGYGTAHHIIGEQFNDMAGSQLLHVPYKGSAPALADLIGGQIQVMFDTVASSLPHIRAGTLRPLAVATAQRAAALPDVPSLSEAGLTGFDVTTWFGLMAPTGTPANILARLQDAVIAATATPEMRAQLLQMGAQPVGSSAASMAQQIQREVQQFGALARKINLNLE